MTSSSSSFLISSILLHHYFFISIRRNLHMFLLTFYTFSLLLPPSPLSFLPPGKDLPLPHASRLGGGGSDYCRRLSGEVAVEEEKEEVRKGIRFRVSPALLRLPPSFCSFSSLHRLLPPGSLETEWLSREGKHAAPPLPSPFHTSNLLAADK